MSEESQLVDKLTEKQNEVKFTQEELKQVQSIQKSYLNIQNQFGQITMAQIRLEEQENSLKKEHENLLESLKNIQSEEKKFLDGITEKYGQGTLNPETGVFIPTENKS